MRRRLPGAEGQFNWVKTVSDKADAAQNALSEMRDGLDSAKRLVERTRSLLQGRTVYDENELRMCGTGDGAAIADNA
jgi:hypothetical protein